MWQMFQIVLHFSYYSKILKNMWESKVRVWKKIFQQINHNIEVFGVAFFSLLWPSTKQFSTRMSLAEQFIKIIKGISGIHEKSQTLLDVENNLW